MDANTDSSSVVFAIAPHWSLKLYFRQIIRSFLGSFLLEIIRIWLADNVAPGRRETKATKFNQDQLEMRLEKYRV